MLMEGLAGELLPRGKAYVGLKALGLIRGGAHARKWTLFTSNWASSRGNPPQVFPAAWNRG